MPGVLQSHSGSRLPTGQHLTSLLSLTSVHLPHTNEAQVSLLTYRNPTPVIIASFPICPCPLHPEWAK